VGIPTRDPGSQRERERECQREGERPARGESAEEIFWTGEGNGIFVFV
jgi:hypothetical protein